MKPLTVLWQWWWRARGWYRRKCGWWWRAWLTFWRPGGSQTWFPWVWCIRDGRAQWCWWPPGHPREWPQPVGSRDMFNSVNTIPCILETFTSKYRCSSPVAGAWWQSAPQTASESHRSFGTQCRWVWWSGLESQSEWLLGYPVPGWLLRPVGKWRHLGQRCQRGHRTRGRCCLPLLQRMLVHQHQWDRHLQTQRSYHH